MTTTTVRLKRKRGGYGKGMIPAIYAKIAALYLDHGGEPPTYYSTGADIFIVGHSTSPGDLEHAIRQINPPAFTITIL